MFGSNKTIIVIFLSRKGCLTYTQAMLSQLQDQQLALVVTKENAPLFQREYNTYTLLTARGKLEHLLRSLTVQKIIDNLVEQLIKTYGSIELYFPAFHPWNLNFIKAAQKNYLVTSLTIHDYKTHSGEQSALVESYQKKMIRLSDRVIFLTDYVRQQAIAEMGDDEKYEVIPHPLIQSTEKQNLEHSTTPSLLFLGRGVAYKGLDLLLSVIDVLPINKLTIAGNQNRPITTKHSKLNIIDRHLEEAEIGKLLATHHILVLPYLDASQSGVLTLGISANIPMVITKVGGLQEQLPPNAAMWVEPTRASLKAGLLQLINEPETYNRLKIALRAHT
jgi:glycosyltransferase involved in cell wall biosynthesis